MVEEGKPAPEFSTRERRRRDGHARVAAREAGRPLLLSQGQHIRLHDAGVRDPRRVERVRARRRGRARRLARRRRVAPEVQGRLRAAVRRCSPIRTTRTAEDYGVWVEKSRYGRTYMGIRRSTFVIGPDGNVVKAHVRRQAGDARRRRAGGPRRLSRLTPRSRQEAAPRGGRARGPGEARRAGGRSRRRRCRSAPSRARGASRPGRGRSPSRSRVRRPRSRRGSRRRARAEDRARPPRARPASPRERPISPPRAGPSGHLPGSPLPRHRRRGRRAAPRRSRAQRPRSSRNGDPRRPRRHARAAGVDAGPASSPMTAAATPLTTVISHIQSIEAPTAYTASAPRSAAIGALSIQRRSARGAAASTTRR